MPMMTSSTTSPIPRATKEEQSAIILIVDQILKAKEENASADTSALEAEIDHLVYHLYGLTYDAPSYARLSTYEKKEMSEEVLIVAPETPITVAIANRIYEKRSCS